MVFFTRLISLLFWCFVLSSSVLLPAKALAKPAKIADLSSLWLVYSPSYKAYIFYDAALVATRPTSLGFLIDQKKVGPYAVQLMLQAQSCIYLNGKLIFYTSVAQQANIILSAAARGSLGSSADSSKLWFLVYQPLGQIQTGSLCLVNTNARMSVSTQSKAHIGLLRPRVVVGQNSGRLVLTLCLGLGLMVLRHFFYRDFQQTVGLHDFLIFPNANYPAYNYRIFTSFNLLLAFANLVGISYIIWTLSRDILWLPFQDPFINRYFLDVSDVLSYLNAFILALLYLLGKYMLIWVFSRLFDLQNYSALHYYEFVRSSSRLHLILLACFVFAYLPNQLSVSDFFSLIKVLIFATVLMRIVQVSILLGKASGFKKIYLFSYLCATEIIPMAFLGKILQ